MFLREHSFSGTTQERLRWSLKPTSQGGLMKIKVKTLGNTVYDLEMKPEVS